MTTTLTPLPARLQVWPYGSHTTSEPGSVLHVILLMWQFGWIPMKRPNPCNGVEPIWRSNPHEGGKVKSASYAWGLEQKKVWTLNAFDLLTPMIRGPTVWMKLRVFASNRYYSFPSIIKSSHFCDIPIWCKFRLSAYNFALYICSYIIHSPKDEPLFHKWLTTKAHLTFKYLYNQLVWSLECKWQPLRPPE